MKLKRFADQTITMLAAMTATSQGAHAAGDPRIATATPTAAVACTARRGRGGTLRQSSTSETTATAAQAASQAGVATPTTGGHISATGMKPAQIARPPTLRHRPIVQRTARRRRRGQPPRGAPKGQRSAPGKPERKRAGQDRRQPRVRQGSPPRSGETEGTASKGLDSRKSPENRPRSAPGAAARDENCLFPRSIMTLARVFHLEFGPCSERLSEAGHPLPVAF